MTLKRLLTVDEVATELGYCRDTVLRKLKRNELKGIKPKGSNRWRVYREDIEDYLRGGYNYEGNNTKRFLSDEIEGVLEGVETENKNNNVTDVSKTIKESEKENEFVFEIPGTSKRAKKEKLGAEHDKEFKFSKSSGNPIVRADDEEGMKKAQRKGYKNIDIEGCWEE